MDPFSIFKQPIFTKEPHRLLVNLLVTKNIDGHPWFKAAGARSEGASGHRPEVIFNLPCRNTRELRQVGLGETATSCHKQTEQVPFNHATPQESFQLTLCVLTDHFGMGGDKQWPNDARPT
ncbi:hypothetical protein GCM10010211_17890 [Streptomyces albospinus]|uniref:Uncharacterized protein n=1 Tax=Streptomyces albospinus TaxID=285515 RepID=A0ABQ2UVA8_9ACTN|nr:hypothetical protein GCM10010211_17890 [Streptomyces albospinus]